MKYELSIWCDELLQHACFPLDSKITDALTVKQ